MYIYSLTVYAAFSKCHFQISKFSAVPSNARHAEKNAHHHFTDLKNKGFVYECAFVYIIWSITEHNTERITTICNVLPPGFGEPFSVHFPQERLPKAPRRPAKTQFGMQHCHPVSNRGAALFPAERSDGLGARSFCEVAAAFLPPQLLHRSFESDAWADCRPLRSAGRHLEGELKLYCLRTGLFQEKPPSLCAFPVWIKSCGEETESRSSSSCPPLPHAR